ncbi:MAG: DMT family transporter [Hungatella sp.]|nr:DMT family transporter [Hungatella sp.]
MNRQLFAKQYGSLVLFLSAFCWSICGVLVKSSDWNAFSIAIFRGVITLVMYTFFLKRYRFHLNRTKCMVAVCYFLQSTLFLLANKYTTAGSATTLQNTSPIHILVFNALLLKKKPSRLELATCGFLLVGICLTLMGGKGNTGTSGDLLALCSGVFYAAVYFFSGLSDADTVESLILGNIPFLFLLPVMFLDPAVRSASFTGWLIPLTCGLVSGAIAWLFFSIGIRCTSPLHASFITMSEPVMSPVWTFLFLRERMSGAAVMGCAIVIVTLIVSNSLRSKRTAAP